jgi:hypothetical protein
MVMMVPEEIREKRDILAVQVQLLVIQVVKE